MVKLEDIVHLLYSIIQVSSHVNAISWSLCVRSSTLFEILASTYDAGQYDPGPLIIWKNILCQICSRIIFEKHTAPGVCSKYVYSNNAPGAYLT